MLLSLIGLTTKSNFHNISTKYFRKVNEPFIFVLTFIQRYLLHLFDWPNALTFVVQSIRLIILILVRHGVLLHITRR
jgi:hypothetical protein